jgi:hypothetical protein
MTHHSGEYYKCSFSRQASTQTVLTNCKTIFYQGNSRGNDPKMSLHIRRISIVRDELYEEGGQPADFPLCKTAVIAFVKNPFAGRYEPDLTSMIDASAELGRHMAKRLTEAFAPYQVQSYGKAAIVGVDGEQEHGNALVSSTFAEPFRAAIGGGKAWISSITKIATVGTMVDVPFNHKDEVYVRSHYDAMSVGLGDGPRPNEIAVIFGVANRGRLNARVGGLTHEELLQGIAS